MKTVTIYHGYDAEGRMVSDGAPDLLVRAYSYETDDNTNINGIYRENNAVDGTEVNVLKGARSLSVGDVVDLDGNLFQCDNFGWSYPTELPGSFVEMEDIKFMRAELNRRFA